MCDSCSLDFEIGVSSSPAVASGSPLDDGLLGSHSFIILHKHCCHHLMTSNHSPQHNPTTSRPHHQCRVCQQCQDSSTHSILARFGEAWLTCQVSSSLAILHTWSWCDVSWRGGWNNQHTHIVSRIHISSSLQQHTNNRIMTIPSCTHHCCPSRLMMRTDGCDGLERIHSHSQHLCSSHRLLQPHIQPHHPADHSLIHSSTWKAHYRIIHTSKRILHILKKRISASSKQDKKHTNNKST